MVKALELLTEMVGSNLKANLDPKAFLEYAVEHPWLINILAASRNHDAIIPAVLEANDFPNAMKFASKEKDRVQALLELQQQFSLLAKWLVTAGRVFNLQVLGFSVLTEKSKKASKKRAVVVKRRKQVRFRRGSIRAKVNRILRQKKSLGLLDFVRHQRAKNHSPAKIGQEIMSITKVKWDPANVNDLMKTYKID